jgi:tetratricopeptide (TPR) repeat protein/TolB-like protein
VSADLLGRLTEALGNSYRIEGELGGGGMSRVFLALEVELDRQVVIKVLPPEMGAGVNQDRFRREVQLAAKLQHSHIVPLLTAGASGDLLYYIMPFIEGESLRAKLAREGELPVGEAARIIREVTDALSYAHERGIVHRDIKPDNVMISSGHALVTDFGVAKAVTESTGGMSLTSLGMALGTPAYMAPEQAAGDPHVDHRADLYALGAMAFEMLAGRPPFTGPNPQALLAAQVTQIPDRVSSFRPAVPPGLETVVMRCLEKRAADRWQKATELLPYLDAVLSPTGGIAPTSVALPISSGTQAAIRRAQPGRVIAMFAGAALVVLAAVYGIVQLVGLPDWVLLVAAGLMAVGLPIMLMTSRQEHERAMTRALTGYAPAPTGIDRHFTWRKAIMGGVAAFVGLGVLAGGFMGLRAAGIGPFGTLVSSGTLKERERIVLAEFENLTPDSTLGATITELLRMDLAQSPMLTVYDAAQVSTVLARMRRSPNEKVTFEVAKEIAAREGLKAVLAGDVRPLGSGFVLSARLVSTGSGDILWAGRQDVAASDGISLAIDKLSATLRERVGESLRSIRADAPLDEVTTASFEALQAYVQADRAVGTGDIDGAIALLERAIEHDSNFAMAWRKIGVLWGNQGREPERRRAALERAYSLRDRLSQRERYLAEAQYQLAVALDTTASVAAYQAVLDRYPEDRIALNNLGLIYRAQGRDAEGLALYKRSIATGAAPATTYGNAIPAEYQFGNPDTARALLAQFQEAYPDNPGIRQTLANFMMAEEQYDSARAALQGLREDVRGTPREVGAMFGLVNLNQAAGRLEESRPLLREAIRRAFEQDPQGWKARPAEVARLADLATQSQFALQYLGDANRAVALLDQAMEVVPAAQRGDDGSPADWAASYADAGRVDRARGLVRDWEKQASDSVRENPPTNWYRTMRALALAEGRHEEALNQARKIRDKLPNCETCEFFEIARIYDAMGQPDSSRVYLEAILAERTLGIRGGTDLPLIYRRLGEIYQAAGDRTKAIEYYTRFVDLWAQADAPLQPKVEEARKRIANLAGEKP